MPLDYNSLLFAIGFASAGLAATMFGSWLSARTDGFLLTWSAGVSLIVAHVFTYSLYVDSPHPAIQLAAFALLLSGLSVLVGATLQFRGSKMPWRLVIGLAAGSTLAFAPATLLGLDGLAVIITNLVAGGLTLSIAYQYWLGRAEATAPISALSVIYALTGLSFFPCSLVLIAGGQLSLGKAPDNWAEDLNLIASIAGITGIGALSLALNQWRAAGRHRRESHTDQLTGLLNRRALFNQIGADPLDQFTGVLLFDLDHFKRINDEFGHAIGDEALRRFALVVNENLRGRDVAARLGGEEFVAILPRTTTDRAHQVAERIRKTFAELVIVTEKGNLQTTVSIGIAFPAGDVRSLEQVLGDADRALYRAKNGGRNSVASANLRLAG